MSFNRKRIEKFKLEDYDPSALLRGKGEFEFYTLAERITQGINGIPAFEPIGRQEPWPAVQMTFDFGTSSSSRRLWRPNQPMYEVHRRALSLMKWAWYTRPGTRGQLSHYVHKDSRYLYILDLKDAFGSVDGQRLAAILYEKGRFLFQWGRSQNEVLDLLTAYFLDPRGGLVQGGPASPYLFQLYVEELIDRPIIECLKRWHAVRYSRFVDDLVLSGKERIGKRKRAEINLIVREAGFQANSAKTRSYDLRRAPIVVNGIGMRLTPRGTRHYLPRKSLRRIEGLLHLAMSGRPFNEQQLYGLMGWLKSSSPFELNRSEQRLVEMYRLFRQNGEL